MKILFVCTGNTCRSPMAKVILEQKLKAAGKLDAFMIDSAAYGYPTDKGANPNAREAIKRLFGEDLLISHKAKELTPYLAEQADLILVMEAGMKKGLPNDKTWTLKEYSGGEGDIADPIGGSVNTYVKCANEISGLLEKVLPKLG
ncbi:MAG: low molecular weight protein arginine phosphatase [Dehalococcoidia bacterium]|nr:low molecular weight protein arginine phosphatase [Dehalococcoidia bacterium]